MRWLLVLHSYALDRIFEVPRAQGRKFSPFPHSAEGETFGGRTDGFYVGRCRSGKILSDSLKRRAKSSCTSARYLRTSFWHPSGPGEPTCNFSEKR